MKQIILEPKVFLSPEVCSGRLLLLWGLYGVGIALISGMLPPNVPDQFGLWVLGALVGLFLAREI